MKKPYLNAAACQWAGRSILLLLAVLAVAMPTLVRWYGRVRLLAPAGQRAVLVGYYLCLVPLALAMLDMDRLLGRIRQGQVFQWANVRLIHRLVWYCATVSLITLACAWWYPPLIFVTVVTAFLCLVIGVVGNVMGAATVLQEENDLTI